MGQPSQENQDSSYVVARVQVAMEHHARALEGMAKEMRQLRESIATNHETYGMRIVKQELEITRLETTLKVSRFWIGICMSILLGVATVLSWATAKFWENLVELNDWKTQSTIRWQQYDRDRNYGNEGRGSYLTQRNQ